MSQPYASGFIVVPNDDTGMGGALINSVSGAISTLTGNVGNGEGGAQLSTGIFAMLHQATTTYSLNIYDTSFAQLHSTVLFTTSDVDEILAPICSDFQSTFYMMQYNGGSSNVAVRACSSAGVAGSTYTLDVHRDPGPCFMGVSDDNTRLYYGQRGNVGMGNTGKSIKRWDLTNNLPLGDFVTSPDVTGRWGEDLIVVPHTNSFVIVYQPNISLENYEIHRYSTVNGSLVASFALPFDAASSSDPRISLDLDAPGVAIWVRTFQLASSNQSTFNQYSLAGIPVSSFAVATDSGDPAKVPLSCPFFAWSNNGGGGGGGAAPVFVGTAATMPIRRERTVPIPVADGNARQTISRLEVQFQPGTGIVDDPLGEPKFMLQVSWDHGKTWSNERLMNAGREGRYLTRAYVNIVGQGRYPVVRIVTSDTFLPIMVGCDVWITESAH